MNLRKIIREELNRMLEANEANPIDNIVQNIQTQLTTDLKNIDAIISTQQLDVKNKDNQIKANLQLKSKLDATNPQKKGLEREIPEDQKDYEKRKKQLKDLEDAKKGMEAAKKEIEKQKMDMEAQAELDAKSGKKAPESNLPSLESPI